MNKFLILAISIFCTQKNTIPNIDFVKELRIAFKSGIIINEKYSNEVIIAGLVKGKSIVIKDDVYTYTFIDTNFVKTHYNLIFFNRSGISDSIHLEYMNNFKGEPCIGEMSYSIISKKIFNNYWSCQVE